MDQPAGKPKVRWGQDRRLTFIEVRLKYDGRINRQDLMTFFNISAPQATADLALYQAEAPNNTSYDTRQRVYQSLPTFKPVFSRTAATRYLDELQRLARGVVDPDESFVGFRPSTGVVATPSRDLQAEDVATLVQAIRDATALRVSYQSMDAPDPQELILSPHAIGFDGLRWHVRAWCHFRSMFRDFAIGRLNIHGHARVNDGADPESDLGWTTTVVVTLIPHPSLSEAQRRCVMKDYGMKHGKLELECRKAMLFYTLRHLNLESLEIGDDPARQHVVVENAKDVQRWMDEDREGNSLAMDVLATAL